MQVIFVCVVCVVIMFEKTWAGCKAKQTTGNGNVFSEEEDVISEYVQIGYSKEITCDVPLSDHVSVFWFFQKKESNVWQPYPFSWGISKFGFRNVELPESKKNRSLLILAAGASTVGKYRCVSQNTVNLAKRIQAVYSLEIFDCVPGRYEPLIKIPPESQLAAVGEKVMVSCTADFGCDDSSSNAVDWLMMEQEELLCITDLNNPHYRVRLIDKNIGRLLNSTLIIKVQEADFGRKFGCMVSSFNNPDAKPKVFPFKLISKVIEADSKPVIKLIVILIIVISIILVLVSVAIYCYAGQRIQLYFRARCGCRQTDKERNQNVYDVVIIHDDEEKDDRILAKDMSDEFTKNDVRVATVMEGGNINYGEDEQYAIRNLLHESASVIFILPNSTDYCYKLNNLFHYIEKSRIIPLKSVFIIGVTKFKRSSKRNGIYAKLLNHSKRPKDSNLQKFCEKMMLKLPLYNRGDNPIGKTPLKQIEGKEAKQFSDIHFVKFPLMEDEGKLELEIEDKLQIQQIEENGKLDVRTELTDEMDAAKEDDITVDVGNEAVDDTEDVEGEESYNKIDTQAVVHHSHSSVEDLDDIAVEEITDDNDDSGFVTLHISC